MAVGLGGHSKCGHMIQFITLNFFFFYKIIHLIIFFKRIGVFQRLVQGMSKLLTMKSATIGHSASSSLRLLLFS